MILFKKPGPKNTERLLTVAKKKGDELGIKNYVLASTRGDTALKAVQHLKGANIIVFTHYTGIAKPNFQEMADDRRELLQSKGCKVFTTTHAFCGVGRSVGKKFGAIQTEQIIAETLKRFGQGTKVAVEVSLMAADAGLINVGEKVISIGGTGLGADTALVLTAVNTLDFFDLKIHEIIAKPE